MGAQMEARPDPVTTSPRGLSSTPQQPADVQALSQQVQGPPAQRESELLLSPGGSSQEPHLDPPQVPPLAATPAADVLGRSALAPAGRRSSWEARELLSDGPPGVLDVTQSSPAHFHQLEAKCGPGLILAGYQIAAHVEPLTSAHTHPGTSVFVRTFTTTTQRQSSCP